MPPFGRSDFFFLKSTSSMSSSSFSTTNKENEIEDHKYIAGRRTHHRDDGNNVITRGSESVADNKRKSCCLLLEGKLQELTTKSDQVIFKIRQQQQQQQQERNESFCQKTAPSILLLDKIIEESIKNMVQSTIDQITNHNLLVVVVEEEHQDNDDGRDITKIKQVKRAVVLDSISNTLYNLNNLEDFALGRLTPNVDIDKIDLRLQELLLSPEQEEEGWNHHLHQQQQQIECFCPRAILSSHSNCPSFEFVAGNSNSKFHNTEDGSSTSLQVTVTPFIFIRSDTLLALDDDDDGDYQYGNRGSSTMTQRQKSSSVPKSKYDVKIGCCSHTVLFTSTSSGCIVGEAKVEIHITPMPNTSSSTSSAFSSSWNDKGTNVTPTTRKDPPKVVDVRACQMNVTPRKIQNRLDLYSSSKFGNENLTLIVKMRTSQALPQSPPHQHRQDQDNDDDDANPMVMDVQVVLEP